MAESVKRGVAHRLETLNDFEYAGCQIPSHLRRRHDLLVLTFGDRARIAIMAIGKLGFVIALPLLAALAGEARACDVAPFVETWANQGPVTWVPTGNGCRLESRIATTGDATASATAHYRRADPQQPLTVTFRVDAPIASQSWNVMSIATLLRGVSRSTPAAGPDSANVLEVRLFGNVTGTSGVLGVSTACTTSSTGICLGITPTGYAAFPLRVTVSLSFGDGAAGELKLWLGDDTSGTPAINLTNLDNTRWQGMERLGIGLLQASAGLRQRLAGQPIVFDQIGVSDPQLFVDGFDSNFAANVVPTVATPLSNNQIVVGTTCGGSTKLPQLASGSASLAGPAAIYVLPGGPFNPNIVLSNATFNLAMFLCPSDAGPASNCTDAIGIGSGPLPARASMDDRRLVVAAVDGGTGACGSFTLTVTGPLGVPVD